MHRASFNRLVPRQIEQNQPAEGTRASVQIEDSQQA
jgi:hypothetical protein